MSFGCVILTMGDRPKELARAVESVTAQEGVDVDCLVVVNGGELAEPPDGARVLELPENLGIPGGRNRGLAEVAGDYVLFLDDDAWLASDDILLRARAAFEGDARLGVISMHLVDPDGRTMQRRHVPRLHVGDPAHSSDVTTFLGGASVIRRAVFDEVGDFPAEFFYGHEEMSLAWRAIDAGYRIRYTGDLLVHHPSTPATRHGRFHYLTARNRVWLVRKHLPLPVALLHMVLWLALSLVRAGGSRGARHVLRGFRDGVTQATGARDPIRWATVWRMIRAGRPPLL